MTLAWHEVRTLEPVQFPAYEEALLSRAAQNETVLGFVRLSRCVLIGALDDPHRALRLSYIGTRFPVVRRRTGGGSLSLDPGTLMLVAAFPSSFKATDQLADLIESLCAPLVDVIRDYGIDAQFTAPNDIVSAGRKIASAFIARGRDGLLFEVALSLSLDIEEMLKTLRLPLEKLSEKGLLAARQRFAPLQISIPGLRPSVLRSRIVSACARALHIDARREPPPSSLERVDAVDCAPQVAADVSAFLKTPGGVLYLDIWLDGMSTVRKARFTGGIAGVDTGFFAHLQDRLTSTDIADIEDTLKQALPVGPLDLIGMDAADIVYLGHLGAARFSVGVRLGFANAGQITLFSPSRSASMEIILAGIATILLPYCAKPVWCKWRHRDGCPECGQCEVGLAYGLARERGLEVITITAYEHLCAVLGDMKTRAVPAFLGVCCTDFFLKRDYAFVAAGIAAVFINIGGDTCYTLRAEEEAYAGRFEAQAFLNPKLLTEVLTWRDTLVAQGKRSVAE